MTFGVALFVMQYYGARFTEMVVTRGSAIFWETVEEI